MLFILGTAIAGRFRHRQPLPPASIASYVIASTFIASSVIASYVIASSVLASLRPQLLLASSSLPALLS